MFSPEVFYPTVRDNFSPSPDDILYVPIQDGVKNLENFIPLISDKPSKLHVDPNFANNQQIKFSKKPWIMYDQEPATSVDVSIYRSRMAETAHPMLESLIYSLPSAALLATFFKTRGMAIWCHSHQNSSFVDELQSYLFHPCYYWYHAFVARDWFRHWQYHKDLAVYDRSDASFRFLLYARDHSGTRCYRQHLVERLASIQHHLCYDWAHTGSITADYSAKITAQDSVDAGIHLVAETVFDCDGVYLTEKIFKPIAMSQPFVLFGPPGALAYLRRYGFQTFGHIWDESYDLEIDHHARLEKLIALVQDLARLNRSEWQQLYQRCLPVIEHNRRRFYATEFMDFCWQELCGNLSQALDQRDRLAVEYPGGQFLHAVDSEPDLLKIPMIKGVLANLVKSMSAADLEQVRRVYPAMI